MVVRDRKVMIKYKIKKPQKVNYKEVLPEEYGRNHSVLHAPLDLSIIHLCLVLHVYTSVYMHLSKET